MNRVLLNRHRGPVEPPPGPAGLRSRRSWFAVGEVLPIGMIRPKRNPWTPRLRGLGSLGSPSSRPLTRPRSRHSRLPREEQRPRVQRHSAFGLGSLGSPSSLLLTQARCLPCPGWITPYFQFADAARPQACSRVGGRSSAARASRFAAPTPLPPRPPGNGQLARPGTVAIGRPRETRRGWNRRIR